MDRVTAKMAEITEAYIEHYKSDFYNYDILTMGRCYPHTMLLWIIRKTGTYLIGRSDGIREEEREAHRRIMLSIFNHYRNSKESRFYIIETTRGLKEVTDTEAAEFLDGKQFKIEEA